MKFEVLIMVTMKSIIFRDIASCSLVKSEGKLLPDYVA
jgi:hypothetical protein